MFSTYTNVRWLLHNLTMVNLDIKNSCDKSKSFNLSKNDVVMLVISRNFLMFHLVSSFLSCSYIILQMYNISKLIFPVASFFFRYSSSLLLSSSHLVLVSPWANTFLQALQHFQTVVLARQGAPKIWFSVNAKTFELYLVPWPFVGENFRYTFTRL